jgi:hypothetical protein
MPILGNGFFYNRLLTMWARELFGTLISKKLLHTRSTTTMLIHAHNHRSIFSTIKLPHAHEALQLNLALY